MSTNSQRKQVDPNSKWKKIVKKFDLKSSTNGYIKIDQSIKSKGTSISYKQASDVSFNGCLSHSRRNHLVINKRDINQIKIK